MINIYLLFHLGNLKTFIFYLYKRFKQFLEHFYFRAEKKIKHCRIKLEGRLYIIGVKQFESLVELIKYYEYNYLYKKIKLWFPVNEDIVLRMGCVSIHIKFII